MVGLVDGDLALELLVVLDRAVLLLRVLVLLGDLDKVGTCSWAECSTFCRFWVSGCASPRFFTAYSTTFL